MRMFVGLERHLIDLNALQNTTTIIIYLLLLVPPVSQMKRVGPKLASRIKLETGTVRYLLMIDFNPVRRGHHLLLHFQAA